MRYRGLRFQRHAETEEHQQATQVEPGQLGDPDLLESINKDLATIGLHYSGGVKVRHLFSPEGAEGPPDR